MGATVFPKPLDHEVDENAQAESSTSLIVARHNLNLGAFTSANFYALVTDVFAAINTSYPLADLALGSIVTGSLVWTNNDSFYYVYTSTSGYGTLQISSTWLVGEAAVNKSTLALVAFNFHNSSSLAINAIINSAPKAISKGQYVSWNGALRKAKAAIASGESLSSSNLEDVADGGLNDLNSKIAKIGVMEIDDRNIASNTTVTIPYSGSAKGFLVTAFANDVNVIGLWMVYQRSDAVKVVEIKQSSKITISQNSGTASSIDITNTYAYALHVQMVRLL